MSAKHRRWHKISILFLVTLMVGNGLLFWPGGSMLRTAGVMMLLLLPGLAWAEAFGIATHRLMRLAIGLGLSYALLIVLGMLLHYLPGGILPGAVLVPLNLITLGAVVWDFIASREMPDHLAWPSRITLLVLLLILLYGGFFRFVNLGYSEFQGDEVEVLVPAAEAIEGRSEALFWGRRKGPGEILIPMMVWRLTELVDEATARALFAVAGVMVIVTTYVLGSRLFSESLGLLAAGLVAMNGFMVAFSRIVQYQAVVVWLSLLALLCAWEWRQDKRVRWWVLVGLFLGSGVLAHYDTILVVPVVAYVFLADDFSGIFKWSKIKGPVAGGVTALVVVGLFFAPYLLNPQFAETSKYLSRRIDLDASQTSLYSFYFFTIFYNSIYFVLLVGGLALGFLVWAVVNLSWVRHRIWAQVMLTALALTSVVGLAFWPNALALAGVDAGFVPFTLIFLGAFLSPIVTFSQRVIIVWLAIAFLGYNFVVGDPRTHFYTITLPIILLASIAGEWVWFSLAKKFNWYIPVTVTVLLTLLFSGHLYTVYLRQNPEYVTDWPKSQPLLYKLPYHNLPNGIFGMVHKSGWKTVGGLYIDEQINGDYQTNGRYEEGDWYTRHRLRGCYQESELFFKVSYLLVDQNDFLNYGNIGEINLSNGNKISVLEHKPLSSFVGVADVDHFTQMFDSTARPSAFIRPILEKYLVTTNLADVVELTGYEIENLITQPGKQIMVNLNWKSLTDISIDLNIFVHLESISDATEIWGQSNGSPACGRMPTTEWQINTVIEDLHIIQVSPNTPPGEYLLTTGMYVPDSGVRLPIFNSDGDVRSDRIILEKITVQ